MGGHSGGDIHIGLANANKLLARFLANYTQDLNLHIIHFNGGTFHNAIPREAYVLLALPSSYIEQLNKSCDDFLSLIKSEFSAVEKNLSLSIEAEQSTAQMLGAECQQRLIALLNSTPNGVIRMSNTIKNVVESSLNLGVVSTELQEAKIICLIRSLIDSGKDNIVSSLKSLNELAGAHIEVKGSYPGWEPNPHSPMMNFVCNIYQKLFNVTPNIMVIHAGLECGLFKKPYPNMDMVSIGPTIKRAHSPSEQVHIKSVERYWTFLTEILKTIPEKF